MANNKSMQILRGKTTFTPSESNEILLDGQLFYSKQTKQLYIGDGTTNMNNKETITLSTGKEVEVSTFKPIGAANLIPGKGKHSIIQDVYEYGEVNDGIYTNEYVNEATGSDSIALGYGSKALNSRAVAIGNKCESSGNSSFTIGQVNRTGYGNINNNTSTGNGSFTGGNGNENDSDYSLIYGSQNKSLGFQGKINNEWYNQYNLISGYSNRAADSYGSIIIGRRNTLGLTSDVTGNSPESYTFESIPTRTSQIFGEFNKAFGYNISLIGTALSAINNTNNSNKIFVGMANKDEDGIIFGIGNGTYGKDTDGNVREDNSTIIRHNALEVYKNKIEIKENLIINKSTTFNMYDGAGNLKDTATISADTDGKGRLDISRIYSVDSHSNNIYLDTNNSQDPKTSLNASTWTLPNLKIIAAKNLPARNPSGNGFSYMMFKDTASGYIAPTSFLRLQKDDDGVFHTQSNCTPTFDTDIVRLFELNKEIKDRKYEDTNLNNNKINRSGDDYHSGKLTFKSVTDTDNYCEIHDSNITLNSNSYYQTELTAKSITTPKLVVPLIVGNNQMIKTTSMQVLDSNWVDNSNVEYKGGVTISSSVSKFKFSSNNHKWEEDAYGNPTKINCNLVLSSIVCDPSKNSIPLEDNIKTVRRYTFLDDGPKYSYGGLPNETELDIAIRNTSVVRFGDINVDSSQANFVSLKYSPVNGIFTLSSNFEFIV